MMLGVFTATASGRTGSVTGEMYPLVVFVSRVFRGVFGVSVHSFPVRPPRQPYALDTPTFAFAAIATFASRAPIGGAREIALAAWVTARMADDVRGDSMTVESRRTRAASARRWLSTLTIADPARRVFTDLIAATETDALTSAAAVRRVIEVTGTTLDGPSRSELERLAGELELDASSGT
jgi:hypothetical protein